MPIKVTLQRANHYLSDTKALSTAKDILEAQKQVKKEKQPKGNTKTSAINNEELIRGEK